MAWIGTFASIRERVGWAGAETTTPEDIDEFKEGLEKEQQRRSFVEARLRTAVAELTSVRLRLSAASFDKMEAAEQARQVRAEKACLRALSVRQNFRIAGDAEEIAALKKENEYLKLKLAEQQQSSHELSSALEAALFRAVENRSELNQAYRKILQLEDASKADSERLEDLQRLAFSLRAENHELSRRVERLRSLNARQQLQHCQNLKELEASVWSVVLTVLGSAVDVEASNNLPLLQRLELVLRIAANQRATLLFGIARLQQQLRAVNVMKADAVAKQQQLANEQQQQKHQLQSLRRRHAVMVGCNLALGSRVHKYDRLIRQVGNLVERLGLCDPENAAATNENFPLACKETIVNVTRPEHLLNKSVQKVFVLKKFLELFNIETKKIG